MVWLQILAYSNSFMIPFPLFNSRPVTSLALMLIGSFISLSRNSLEGKPSNELLGHRYEIHFDSALIFQFLAVPLGGVEIEVFLMNYSFR